MSTTQTIRWIWSWRINSSRSNDFNMLNTSLIQKILSIWDKQCCRAIKSTNFHRLELMIHTSLKKTINLWKLQNHYIKLINRYCQYFTVKFPLKFSLWIMLWTSDKSTREIHPQLYSHSIRLRCIKLTNFKEEFCLAETLDLQWTNEIHIFIYFICLHDHLISILHIIIVVLRIFFHLE